MLPGKKYIAPGKKSKQKIPHRKWLWMFTTALILAITIFIYYYPHNNRVGASKTVTGNIPPMDSVKKGTTLPQTIPVDGPGPHDIMPSAPIDDTSVSKEPPKQPPVNKTDSAKQPANIDMQERSAVLGYSFFKNMRQDETRNITAYVKIINDSSIVVSRLKTVASGDIPVRPNDTVSIYTENILLYRYLNINLIDGDSDFAIKPIHIKSRQKIDSAKGNTWAWAITPKTAKKHGRLILQVIAEDAIGEADPLESRNISIDISLDRSLLRRLWTFINGHPLETLTLILIPIIAFFGKNLLFKKKNKNEG